MKTSRFLLMAIAVCVVASLFAAPLLMAPDLVVSAMQGVVSDLFRSAPDLFLATTLAVNVPRTYEIGDIQSLPMVATDIIYEGSAVGDNGSGIARPLVALDPFLGFAVRQADNATGAASAVNVDVKVRGQIVLTVAGASSADDVGAAVYASDDATFTLTSTNNTAIGKVSRWVTSTTCVVYFEAVPFRSI